MGRGCTGLCFVSVVQIYSEIAFLCISLFVRILHNTKCKKTTSSPLQKENVGEQKCKMQLSCILIVRSVVLVFRLFPTVGGRTHTFYFYKNDNMLCFLITAFLRYTFHTITLAFSKVYSSVALRVFRVVQLSPLWNSRTFPSPRKETPSPSWPLPAPHWQPRLWVVSASVGPATQHLA